MHSYLKPTPKADKLAAFLVRIMLVIVCLGGASLIWFAFSSYSN